MKTLISIILLSMSTLSFANTLDALQQKYEPITSQTIWNDTGFTLKLIDYCKNNGKGDLFSPHFSVLQNEIALIGKSNQSFVAGETTANEKIKSKSIATEDCQKIQLLSMNIVKKLWADTLWVTESQNVKEKGSEVALLEFCSDNIPKLSRLKESAEKIKIEYNKSMIFTQTNSQDADSLKRLYKGERAQKACASYL